MDDPVALWNAQYDILQVAEDSLMADALRALYAHAKREGMREAAGHRSAVPVLPGEMPDEMLAALQSDKETAAEALRIVVRQTLDEYEQAILRAAEEVKP